MYILLISALINTAENCICTRQNTKLLLERYAEKKNDFRNPKIKKRTLWEEIKQDFASKGYNVTIDMLDRKMRNMKHTLKVIKDNNKKSTTGRGRIQWEWFEAMDNIFLEDHTINIGHTLSSLLTTSGNQQHQEIITSEICESSMNMESAQSNNASITEIMEQFQPVIDMSSSHAQLY